MNENYNGFGCDSNSRYSDSMSTADKVRAVRESMMSRDPEHQQSADSWEKTLEEMISRHSSFTDRAALEVAMEPLPMREPEPELDPVQRYSPVSHFYGEENVRRIKPISHFKEDVPPDITPKHGRYERVENLSEELYPITEETRKKSKTVKKKNPEYKPKHAVDEGGRKRNKAMNEPEKKKKKTFGQRVRGLFPQKGDGFLEGLRKIIFLGACGAVIVCGGMVLNYYIDTIGTQNGYDDIEKIYHVNSNVVRETSSEEDSEHWEMFSWAAKLSKQNPDLMGFITIPSNLVEKDGKKTNEEDVLAYPVVQAKDLEKYMHLSFTGEEARAGTLFFDYRNHFDDVVDGKLSAENSDNLVIYGHNMKTGDMFGALQKYKDYDAFYGEHPIINLDSRYQHYQFKIFSFFLTDVSDKSETAYDCWYKFDFDDEEDFYGFVNEAKRRTLRTNDVDVRYGDMILTLSTCHAVFGQDGPGRLIVMARQVREGEDLLEGTQNSQKNTNIKWPSLYYKYNSNEKYDEENFVPYEEFNKEKDKAAKNGNKISTDKDKDKKEDKTEENNSKAE